MSTQGLIIVGAGGHAKVVADAALLQRKHTLLGFVDPAKAGTTILGHEIFADASKFKAASFVAATGDNKLRKTLYEQMIAAGWEPAIIVHPSSVIASDVLIGSGTVILAGSVINCSTSIGANCIVNTSASIDHDCSIGAHAHISPGCHLAGQVKVAEGAFLGIGTVVIPSLSIGAWSVSGAGAVIIRSVEAQSTVMGIPARHK